MIQRFKDTPEADRVSEREKDKIMHVSLPVGKANILMATDALESMGQKLDDCNRFYISISSESKEEAEKLFKGLSAGGEVTMPLQDTFWGAYFGMTRDKFGIQWMVGYSKNQQQ